MQPDRNIKTATIDQDPALSDRICFCVSPNHYRCIPKKDIIYIGVSVRGYVVIYTLGGKEFELSTNLGNVEQQLGDTDFIRTSRQHLINRKHIVSIKGTEVTLAGNVRLEMSKTGAQKLFDNLPLLRTAQWTTLKKSRKA